MKISIFLKHIATLGPVGYMPLAPGTFGTLTALILIALLKPSYTLHIIITVLSIIIGTTASHRAENLFDVKDPQQVVIDEFSGYLLATAFLPQSRGYLIFSFILFRVLDILKPPPVRTVEGLSGGAGIMADDLIAGIYTNLILQIWRLLA